MRKLVVSGPFVNAKRQKIMPRTIRLGPITHFPSHSGACELIEIRGENIRLPEPTCNHAGTAFRKNSYWARFTVRKSD